MKKIRVLLRHCPLAFRLAKKELFSNRTNVDLTFNPDHLKGAGQPLLRFVPSLRRVCLRPCLWAIHPLVLQ